MAYLAVHAHLSPAEFKDMDPGETRALTEAVTELVNARDDMYLELAKLAGLRA